MRSRQEPIIKKLWRWALFGLVITERAGVGVSARRQHSQSVKSLLANVSNNSISLIQDDIDQDLLLLEDRCEHPPARGKKKGISGQLIRLFSDVLMTVGLFLVARSIKPIKKVVVPAPTPEKKQEKQKKIKKQKVRINIKKKVIVALVPEIQVEHEKILKPVLSVTPQQDMSESKGEPNRVAPVIHHLVSTDSVVKPIKGKLKKPNQKNKLDEREIRQKIEERRSQRVQNKIAKPPVIAKSTTGQVAKQMKLAAAATPPKIEKKVKRPVSFFVSVNEERAIPQSRTPEEYIWQQLELIRDMGQEFLWKHDGEPGRALTRHEEEVLWQIHIFIIHVRTNREKVIRDLTRGEPLSQFLDRAEGVYPYGQKWNEKLPAMNDFLDLIRLAEDAISARYNEEQDDEISVRTLSR